MIAHGTGLPVTITIILIAALMVGIYILTGKEEQ